MSYNIILGSVMFASMLGMIFCAKKQSVSPIAKPAALVFLLIILACAITATIHNLKGPDLEALRNDDLVFHKAKTYVLGKKIAKLNPGGKVLFVVASTKGDDPIRDALIEGFKEGAGSGLKDIKVIVPSIRLTGANPAEVVAIKEKLAEDPMQLPDMLRAKDFNKMLSVNRGYNIVVSTIGLPDDMENLAIWEEFDKNPKKSHRLAFVGGDTSKFAPLVKLGLIQAIVRYKRDVNYDLRPPKDLAKAFDLRYVLITKDNIDKVIKDNPYFFDKK